MDRALSMVEQLRFDDDYERHEELTQYITASEDGTDCVECFDKENIRLYEDFDEAECEKIQKKIDSHVWKTYAEPFVKQCGQEGSAYILGEDVNKSVVKVILTKDVASHKRRTELWNFAAKRQVGPAILNDSYEEMEDVCASFIHMEFLPKCDAIDSGQLKDLVDKTSKAKLLHTDTHFDNVRCTEDNVVKFIDWDGGLMNVDGDPATIAYLMLVKLYIDSYKTLEKELHEEMISLQKTHSADADAFIDGVKDEFVRQTLKMNVILLNEKLNNATVHEAMKKTRTPLQTIYQNI